MTWALANWWLLPVVGAAVVLVLGFWMLMRRERADAQAERVEFHQTHVAPEVDMWTLQRPIADLVKEAENTAVYQHDQDQYRDQQLADRIWSMPEVEGNWREGVR